MSDVVCQNGIKITKDSIALTVTFETDPDGASLDVSAGKLRVKPLGLNDGHVAAENKDGLVGTPSMRTLGTGAQQAAPGTAQAAAIAAAASDATAKANAAQAAAISVAASDATAKANAAQAAAIAAAASDATAKANAAQAAATEASDPLGAAGVVQGNIDAEAARAIAAEGVVQSNIDAEAARATTAESVVQANVDSEVARAEAAEAALGTIVLDGPGGTPFVITQTRGNIFVYTISAIQLPSNPDIGTTIDVVTQDMVETDRMGATIGLVATDAVVTGEQVIVSGGHASGRFVYVSTNLWLLINNLGFAFP